MNKIILALALVLAPFFSIATEYYVPAKQGMDLICYEANANNNHLSAKGSYCALSADEAKQGACDDAASNASDITTDSYNYSNSVDNFSCSYQNGYYYVNYTLTRTGIMPYASGTSSSNGAVVASLTEKPQESAYECPPDNPDHSEYTEPYDSDNDGSNESCKLSTECPIGYYKYKVRRSINHPLECVPVQCESQGTEKSFWAKGSVYNNTAGTYCNGSCAYSVNAGQNSDGYSGSISLKGTSTGEICGQGSFKESWFNEGNNNECENTTLDNGSSFLSCPNGTGGEEESPQPSTEEVTLEEEKVDIEDIPEITPSEETCAEGDPSCEIRNLKKKIESENEEQNIFEMEKHNKSIQAQEKSTNSIISAINGAREANTRAIESLEDAVGSGDGGEGGGGDGEEGFCDTEGNCSTSIETRTEPSDGLEGFWDTEYPDGLEGMFKDKLNEVKATEFYAFLDQFKPKIGGGTAPMFNWCFNFGGYMNFGCHSITIDPRVYPALKIFILISAAFGCRRILFGG